MKKRSFLYFLPVYLIISLSHSCKSTDTPMLPGISGSSGEVLVVVPGSDWEGEIGNALREVFMEELTYLPQPEEMFSYIQIKPEQFGPVFQSHRTPLIIKTSAEYNQPRISVRNDVWARPQTVIEMSGPDAAALAAYIRESKKELQDRINRSEQERLINTYTHYQDKKIFASLREKHGISLAIPMGYKIDYDTTGFVSISNDTPESTQGILVYYYAYTDTNTFTPDYLILKRNQFTRKYIEGPSQGSWMAVEELIEPSFTEFNREDRYFARLRGLWKLEKGSGGGPFINLSTVDEKRQRVVSVDGFVFAPGQGKRELRRQVEAIVHSLEILE